MTRRRFRAPLQRIWTLAAPRLRAAAMRLLTAAVGVLLAVGMWWGIPRVAAVAGMHPYFRLKHVQIEGARRLRRADILVWAGVHEGSSAWTANPEIVRLRLAAHPWIDRVSVRREFPDHLAISLHERRPAAIVRFTDLQYVDRSGRILGPLLPDDSRDYPLITGLEGVEGQAFAALGIRRALQLMRMAERQPWFDGMSEIHVDYRRGLTLFPSHPAVAFMFGWGQWHEKLARGARLIAAWQGRPMRVAAVDFSFRHMVVVKLQPPEIHRPAGPGKRGLRV